MISDMFHDVRAVDENTPHGDRRDLQATAIVMPTKSRAHTPRIITSIRTAQTHHNARECLKRLAHERISDVIILKNDINMGYSM